jgi:membrane protease YdiL (CAAX protease family)
MSSALRRYLGETRRPIYSAALVFPFFLIYHTGTLLLHTTYINGADALIIRLLSALSVHSVFASALVLIASFVIWQLQTGASWKIDPGKLTILFLESVFFALLLFYGFGWLSVHFSRPAGSAATSGPLTRLVLYCGAGIYEELVFRGFLLSTLMLVLTRVLRFQSRKAAVVAVILGSLLFAAFHYIGAGSDSLSLSSFLQRTLGGLYFSLLFVSRGFGVTAASHALYDILVGLILKP